MTSTGSSAPSSLHQMHRSEHRSYRELAAVVRQMAEHWRTLAGWLPPEQGGEEMAAGADVAGRLAGELDPFLGRYEVSTGPGSQSLGTTIGIFRRAVVDRFLERNQAMRMAVLETHHGVLLLDFLANVAEARSDDEAYRFCERWRGDLAAVAQRAGRAAAALGQHPDESVEPVDPSPAGRAGHAVAVTTGAVGEYVDRRISGHRATAGA